MSSVDDYIKRKAARDKIKDRPLLSEAVTFEKVQKLLDCQVDENRINSFNYTHPLIQPAQISQQEVQKLLSELKDEWESVRVDQLFSQIKNDVIHSIAVPFGLGKVVSAYDKVGGNVDTIHNVRDGVYATENEQHKYESLEDYKDIKDSIHSDPRYVEKNKALTSKRESEVITDSFSDIQMGCQDKHNLDHVKSAKETHCDPARVLAEVDTKDLANIDANLQPTTESINKSKGAKSADDFIAYLKSTKPARKERINYLSNKETLTDKESKELKKLKELDSVNIEEVRNKDKQARRAQDDILNKEYYMSGKFLKNTAKTSALEGVKMGGQQAFGIMLVEFFSQLFVEIKKLINEGREQDSLFAELHTRFTRIAKNTASKWKGILSGGLQGFISGLLSNIATTIINAFVTTGKRVVRMIREGLFSLLKAMKIMLLPEEGMTRAEAAHAGMKILASGGIIFAGVALEEVIEKMIMSVPVLASMAFTLSAVIVGSISAMAMGLASYLLDKLDLFGVLQKEAGEYILKSLDNRIDSGYKRSQELIHEIENYSLVPC